MKISYYQTLEELEKEVWGEASYDSSLVKKCHSLRKKQLRNFDIEGLRIMIGQKMGLPYLIPLAIEKLTENILAEGDLYPGDLLKSVLSVKEDFWKEHPLLWKNVKELVNNHREIIDNEGISINIS